jgi:hypothetical protein
MSIANLLMIVFVHRPLSFTLQELWYALGAVDSNVKLLDYQIAIVDS